jgi:hypothetical protein
MAKHGAAENAQTHSGERHEPHESALTTESGVPVEAAPLETLFEPDEFAQFDRDDTAAGSHIGKMLALFFLYTVIVMALVAWWTYRAVHE